MFGDVFMGRTTPISTFKVSCRVQFTQPEEWVKDVECEKRPEESGEFHMHKKEIGFTWTCFYPNLVSHRVMFGMSTPYLDGFRYTNYYCS